MEALGCCAVACLHSKGSRHSLLAGGACLDSTERRLPVGHSGARDSAAQCCARPAAISRCSVCASHTADRGYATGSPCCVPCNRPGRQQLDPAWVFQWQQQQHRFQGCCPHRAHCGWRKRHHSCPFACPRCHGGQHRRRAVLGRQGQAGASTPTSAQVPSARRWVRWQPGCAPGGWPLGQPLRFVTFLCASCQLACDAGKPSI